MDIIDMIMAFEQGDMDNEAIIALFQKLINTGDAWRMQGSIGRIAKALVADGFCTLSKGGVL